MQTLILGMHRSATSATARLMNMMGIHVGAPGELLAANPDNPKGFWERRDVLDANRALLQHLRCNWYRIENYDENRLKNLPHTITQRQRAILSKLPEPWLIKDPRLCLTLPAWLPLLKEPVAVIVWRNPLEIAHSLLLRNRMPLEFGLALWEMHAVGIVRHAASLRKIFTRHDDTLENPVAATRKLYESLNMPSLHMPSDAEILEFIEPKLNRAQAQNHTLTPHHEKLSAMLRGEMAFDASLQLSPQSRETLVRLGPQVTQLQT